MKRFLITGATGGNAIKKVLELKVPVRALVHQVDERSKKLSSQGVEIVQGDRRRAGRLLGHRVGLSDGRRRVHRRCRHPADVPCARRFQALNIAYSRGCAMKIGIIGTVGKMLATKLAEKGRPVLVANSRSPEGVADSLAASEASLMPSSTPEARLS